MENTYYGVEPYTGKILKHVGKVGMKWGYTDLGRKLVDAGKRAVSTTRNTVARGIYNNSYDADFNKKFGSGVRKAVSRAIGDKNFDNEQDFNEDVMKIASKKLNKSRSNAYYNSYNPYSKTNNFNVDKARKDSLKSATKDVKRDREAKRSSAMKKIGTQIRSQYGYR